MSALLIVSSFSFAASLDEWQALEDSPLPPHEKISLAHALIEQHTNQHYLEGQLRGNIQLANSYLSLEDMAQSQIYLDKAKSLNSQLNASHDSLRINNIQAALFAMEGRLKEAMELAIASLALSKTFDDELLQGDTLLNYAYIMQLESQFAEAIERLYEAQVIFERMNNKMRIMTTYSHLAIIYSKLKNDRKAIEYYQHAAELAEELGDDFGLSIFYYNLGTAFSGLEDWPQTVYYFSKARELSVVLEDNAGIALSTAQLGRVMMNNSQYQDALPLLIEANERLLDSGVLYMRMRIKLNIAMCYAKIADNELAKAYITEVELMMAVAGSEDERFPYLLLGKVYAELGDYQKSSYIFQRHIDFLLRDFESKKSLSLQRLEVIYDVRFEKSRNELLRQENRLAESELARQNQSRLILALTLVLVLMFLGFTFRQIRIQRGQKRRFKALAFKDDLTQIANRRGILDFARASYNQTKIDSTKLVLAIIDLDYFKQVNDTYGHDMGDQVLIYFANMASQCLRRYEMVGRYGGEEWLVVLPKAEEKDILPLFDRLAHCYKEQKPNELPAELHLGFSMGAVVTLYRDDVTVEMLLKTADAALYKAKENGRGRCEVTLELVQ
ncbi:GGDEF domain-containing protein [Motilimonas cestriensis]|uniref:diguanylate cyclase n=1 Tax=Motilimonas cestriensis TaxID=2742685 RepID=A0ABS8WBU4_9GAMM|nr:diguanylate cyclase [Motilimonas cestriensis]MCE2595960.1 GGDEF domain-containing protein [Motilimonas cestriensis]